MTDKQSRLKARLLKWRDNFKAYAPCHPQPIAYRLAAGMYGLGGKPGDAFRYVEKPASHGLRVVGFANEIVHLDYTGWYADEFQEAVYRGVVFQLPARGGQSLYMAAYADPHNDGPVCVSMRDGTFSDKEDAARAADSFAEREAEKARDYEEASRMGNQWCEHGEEVTADRAEIKALLAEIRAAKVGPVICATLRGRIRSMRHSMHQAAEAQRKLGDTGEYNSWWLSKYGPVFNEAAGKEVL